MTDLELARQIYSSESLSFVLVKNGEVLSRGYGDGIKELLSAVQVLGDETEGASLADKVVGKAVAMVAAYARVSAIYTPLASQAAERVASERQIVLVADRTVPLIRNRRNDGPCPMERLTSPLTEPRDAVIALRHFVAAALPANRSR